MFSCPKSWVIEEVWNCYLPNINLVALRKSGILPEDEQAIILADQPDSAKKCMYESTTDRETR